MAHISDNSGNGRDSNFDVNLVPFIDLMSVLVIFLLITAVWSQVSMIQIGSSIYGQSSPNQKEIKLTPNIEIPFRLDIKKTGYRVIIGQKVIKIKKEYNEYNKISLSDELAKIKNKYPEKVDALITMEEELEYEFLIGGMDSLLQAGFSDISIATGGVR